MLALYARCYFLFNFYTRTSSKRYGTASSEEPRWTLISQAESFIKLLVYFVSTIPELIDIFNSDISLSFIYSYKSMGNMYKLKREISQFSGEMKDF